MENLAAKGVNSRGDGIDGKATHRPQEIILIARRPQVDWTGPDKVIERAEYATGWESLDFAELDAQPLCLDALQTSDFDGLDGILSNGEVLQERELDVRPLRRPVVVPAHLGECRDSLEKKLFLEKRSDL